MDIAWHGTLTCDYEHDRPQATNLERELYTRSLIAWPSVLLGDASPYGRLRRPGIVDIPEQEHLRLTRELHASLADPRGAQRVSDGSAAGRARATSALDSAELRLADGSRDLGDLKPAADAVLTVMSAHIVNWLLPEQAWETRMTKLLGSRTAARACIAALSTPASMGHLLASLSMARRADDAAGLPADTAIPRTNWLAAAVLAAAGDAPSLDAVRAMTIILRWAADSEERRRELRERFLGLVSQWCQLTGRDQAQVTLDDLGLAESPS